MTNPVGRMAEGVKKAMEAEVDGFHFYMMAARSTSDAQGRQVFEQLAQEEMEHARFLKAQYAALIDTGMPDPSVKLATQQTLSGDNPIFSADLKGRLSDAHYEMSALSIGIQLELSAVQFYSAEAEAATDPTVRAFFLELAQWERGHHEALNRQLQGLKEDYWSGGGFSPF